MLRTSIAALLSIALFMSPVLASADSIAELEAQLSAYQKQMTMLQERMAKIQTRLDALRIGTTTARGDAPSCEIKTDKDIYQYGETAVLSWASKRATYAAFVQPASGGKDFLPVPGDKLPASGTQRLVASVIGMPDVSLAVYSATGVKGICRVVLRVKSPVIGATTTPPQTGTTTPIGPVATSATAVLASVSLSTDASSPSIQNVTGGATGVVIGAFRVAVSGDSFLLEKIGFKLSSGTPGDVTNLSIYSSTGTLLGTAVFAGTATVATSTFAAPVKILRDTALTIVVKAEIAGIGNSQPGTPGDLVRVDAINLQGTSITSGTTIRAQGQAATMGVRIFRSIPTVSIDPISSIGMVDGRLLRVRITAAPAGQVSLGKLTFSVSATNATVSQLRLFAYTDSSYSQAISGAGTGGQIGSTASGTPLAIFSPTNPVVIPPGATYYLELRGAVSGATAQSAVTATLLGDAAPAGLTSLAGQSAQRFVWSGNSFTTPSAADVDWANGFAVNGLPAVGISQSRVAVTDAFSSLASAFSGIEQILDSMTAFYFGR